MKTQSLAASSVLNIKMVGTAVELEGVVVTALGIKKSKNSVTSATQVVNNEELTQAANQTWYNR
jgi:outer membrane cobalamin receptor